MSTLLIIEDDPIIARSLQMALELEGYAILHSPNLKGAEEKLDTNKIALILLDINLPDGKGYDFCSEVKKRNNIPIIAITANADEGTAIKTLNKGADDYVRKPFSTRELILRIKLRLSENTSKNTFQLDTLTINLDNRMVLCDEGPIELARKEFDLLVTFAKKIDRIFSREEIIEILDTGSEINDRTIDSHISHLRSRLNKCKCHKIVIKSVYGLGYKLSLEK